MLEGLSALGLVKGDLDETVAKGIAGLFQPHGLGPKRLPASTEEVEAAMQN